MLDVVLKKAPRLQGAVNSMVKACDVLGLLSIVNAGVVTPVQLMNAIVVHYTAQKAYWGTTLWRPK
eukprot:6051352-Pyramimonas_sp.AAC.1